MLDEAICIYIYTWKVIFIAFAEEKKTNTILRSTRTRCLDEVLEEREQVRVELLQD